MDYIWKIIPHPNFISFSNIRVSMYLNNFARGATSHTPSPLSFYFSVFVCCVDHRGEYTIADYIGRMWRIYPCFRDKVHTAVSKPRLKCVKTSQRAKRKNRRKQKPNANRKYWSTETWLLGIIAFACVIFWTMHTIQCRQFLFHNSPYLSRLQMWKNRKKNRNITNTNPDDQKIKIIESRHWRKCKKMPKMVCRWRRNVNNFSSMEKSEIWWLRKVSLTHASISWSSSWRWKCMPKKMFDCNLSRYFESYTIDMRITIKFNKFYKSDWAAIIFSNYNLIDNALYFQWHTTDTMLHTTATQAVSSRSS